MPQLPVISAADAIKAFEKAGFIRHHQRGSHIVLRRQAEPHTHLTVPNHKELKKGTLRALIRAADLSVEEFLELLK